MPALSSTMTEGRIVSWLKNEGDAVKKGEPIVVVESDKADMDVECFNTGILGAIVIPEGEVARVGVPIGYIAETADEIAEAKAKAGAAPAPAPAPPAPEAAAPPPPAAKASPAPASAAAAPPPPPPPPPAPTGPAPRADGRIIATPYAKKLAKELKVDIAKVGGTGPNGEDAFFCHLWFPRCPLCALMGIQALTRKERNARFSFGGYLFEGMGSQVSRTAQRTQTTALS